jgi:hypothetical protein
VRAFDISGAGNWSEPISFQTAVTANAGVIILSPQAKVFPNPFTTDAFLELNLDQPGTVKVYILSLTGSKIADVADNFIPAGKHRIRLDGRELPPGPFILSGRTSSGPFRIKLIHR